VIGPDGAWWGIRNDRRIMRVDAEGDVRLFDYPWSTEGGTQLVVGPDDVLWAVPRHSTTFARISMDGAVTVHPEPIVDTVIGAVTHPDGTVWVLTTEEIVRLATDGAVAGTIPLDNGGGISSALELAPSGDVLAIVSRSSTLSDLVRVTPDGDVTTSPLTGMDDPSEIVVQPDGTVFVAGSSPGVVAEVTAEGLDPVEFDGWPTTIRELVLGHDGAVWVQGVAGAWRIDDNGGVVSVDVPADTWVPPPRDPPSWWVGSLSLGADDRMWVSDFGRLHHIDDDGTFTTQRIGVGNPFTGTAGPDGAAWFGGNLDGHVGRIHGGGDLEVVTDVGAGVAYGITTGPDGNLWATDGGLVRVTPAGEVTAVPLPGITNAWDLTTGADGNLWVIDEAGAVARVGVDGTTTVFPMPDGFGTPFRIVTGGDGNLWVNELDGKDVARITPAGAIDVFPVPATGSVVALTTDPDGAVWAAHDGDSVLRISPAGVTTSTPTPDFRTMTLTGGPDGNLWLAGLDASGGGVARLTPNGALTTWPADIGRAVEAFTTPDGYVWVPNACCFGRREGHSVVRIAVGQVSVGLVVDEDQVTVGDDVRATVTVTNTGPTALTEVEVSSTTLPGCAGDLADLGPGEHYIVTCTLTTTGAGELGLEVAADTAETQPTVAGDVVLVEEEPPVDPPATCWGREVTVDLGADERPTAGADVILGTPQADTIWAGGGDDIICAGAGADVVHAGRGHDQVFGVAGVDRLFGEAGADVLRGGVQADGLSGGGGGDRLIGGADRDGCNGGHGTDRAASCEVLVGIP
jgi:virginiamycin B lyase